jgi:aspartyl/glutamyl-tRNA(Asn/Gln) amidotransferase C subunit
LTQEEKEKLLKEVDPILNYVAQLKEVTSKVDSTASLQIGEHRNIMRDDSNPTETGSNTKVLVDDMPESQGDYLKVKKIL